MQWFYPGMEHFAQGIDIVTGKETGLFKLAVNLIH
jgi:hypothetical protein